MSDKQLWDEIAEKARLAGWSDSERAFEFRLARDKAGEGQALRPLPGNDKTPSEYYWKQRAYAPVLFGVETKSLERALRADMPDIDFETLQVLEVSENIVQIPVADLPKVIGYARDEPQPLSKLDLCPSNCKYGTLTMRLHPIAVDGVTLFVDYAPELNILVLRRAKP